MMKIHMIRCVSILNMFQMNLMKMNYNIENNMSKEFEHDEELRLI
jgi:hypothetical protein